ncbi:MAG: phosphoglucomutase (alpha-D-glucose-1,6-bisphosphate-dependent) [Gemmatimonadales bacterium]
MNRSPLAGKLPSPGMLVDVAKLQAAYFDEVPDPGIATQRVSFGTSGHRGSAFKRTFNEHHVLAISEAICRYRREQGYDGPLFLGIDTHALSRPAAESALEVLAAHGVEVMLAADDDFTPTPVISHAILSYNHGRTTGLADGIVITPSHNPPTDGGFKYNPPNGGPADTSVTRWIEAEANELLEARLLGISRVPHAAALRAATTHQHDYRTPYIDDLGTVIDMDVIRSAGLRLGVDPMGGAGVHYWQQIADRHRLNLTVVSDVVDPTFSFMSVDWDGQLRMDPSSADAMQRLIGLRDQFDIAFACDTDHDRHGIVTRSGGLLSPNAYLAVMVDHLFRTRNEWLSAAAVGKTVVSSSMIDRVAASIGRSVYEVPVGFKWFVDGLFDGSLGFVGEESAGASFLRRTGTVWSTDKDGFIPALLAAEITGQSGKDPAQRYAGLTRDHGEPVYNRVEAGATPAQKARLSKLSADEVTSNTLAGERIESVVSHASGNGAALGGIKVCTASGWFAARPSGTEDIYKIYAESFRGPDHLEMIITEAQAIVDAALG